MTEPGIDLTGKLIIKVALGDDIRRILITNEDITYDELVLMMQRVYRGKLNSNDDIVIKYKDEDNDLITIFDSSDLNFAVQCSRILKITLFVNGKPEPLQSDEAKFIKNELKSIRNRCNALLDKLDNKEPSDNTASSTTVETAFTRVVPPRVSESPQAAMSPRPSATPTKQTGSKEFDPLSSQRSVDEQQNKVMSSFGINNDDRAGSPDSISSVNSISRQKPKPIAGSPYHTGSPAAGAQKVPAWNPNLGQPSAYSQGPQGVYPPQQQVQAGYPQQTVQTSQTGQVATPPPPQQQQYDGYTHPGQQQQPGSQSATPDQQFQQPGYNMGMQQPQQQQQQMPPGQIPQQPGQMTQTQGQIPPQPGQVPQQPGQVPQQPGQVPHPQAQVPQQPGQMPQQPGQVAVQPGQVPQQAGQGTYGYPQAAPAQAGMPPAPGPPGAGNPYARAGPGYGGGYPRPTGTYPQGYQ